MAKEDEPGETKTEGTPFNIQTPYSETAKDRARYRVAQETTLRGWDAVGGFLVTGLLGGMVGIPVAGVIEVISKDLGMSLTIPVIGGCVLAGITMYVGAEIIRSFKRRDS